MLLNPYRFQSGPAGLWTPLNMATVPQIYLDAQDGVVTDVGGFCSAISNLGAMGANGDFSQGTAASRPAIVDAALNGKRVLSFDGIDDRLLAGSTIAKQIFKGTLYAWCFTVFRRRDSTTGKTRALLYTTIGSNEGYRFSVWAGYSGSDNRLVTGGKRLDADGNSTNIVASATLSGYTMALCRMYFSTRVATIEQDAVVLGSGVSSLSAGATSATDAAYPLAVAGFPSGAGGYADVDIAAMLVSNTQPTAEDVNKLFGWAAHKYGLTANLPVDHPYKTTAPTI